MKTSVVIMFISMLLCFSSCSDNSGLENQSITSKQVATDSKVIEIKTDEAQIQKTIIDFFKEVANSYEKDTEISLSKYFLNSNDYKTDENYFVTKIKYYKTLFKLSNTVLQYYKNETTIKNIEINDNTAIATVYDLFTYMDKNGNGMESSTGIEYEMTFARQDGTWKLATIYCSYDEFDGSFYNNRNRLSEVMEELNSNSSDIQTSTQPIESQLSDKDRKEENLPKQIDIMPAYFSPDKDIGAIPMELIYASNEKIIIWGYVGLFVYNLKEESFSHTLDLSYIDCNHQEGWTSSVVAASKDGDFVYIMRYTGVDSMEAMYVYDLIYNTLTKIHPTDIKTRFNNFVDINRLDFYDGGRDFFTGLEVVDLGNNQYGYIRFYGRKLSEVIYAINDKEYAIFTQTDYEAPKTPEPMESPFIPDEDNVSMPDPG